MPAAINTNLNSLSAQRQFAANANSLGTAMQRLSSGLRINSARDDAAGLAISERFTTQIKGADQAARNTNDAISLAQTTESALGQINDNLQRIRELAVQAANSTNSASDRVALQNEVSQLVTEIDRIASQTEFNGSKLLDGSFAGQQFQVGANRQQTIGMTAMGNMRSDALGKYNGFAPNTRFLVPTAPSALTVTLGGPGTVVSLGTVNGDAAAITQAINSGAVPGLTATTTPPAWLAFGQTSVGLVSGSGYFTLNGININVNYVAGDAARNRANAVAAINTQSAATGVTAADSGVGVNLYSDGRNIGVSYTALSATGSTSGDFGILSIAAVEGQVNVSYQVPTGSAVTSITFTGAGMSTVPITVLPTGNALSAVDISTTAGANAAIDTIDVALTSVNAARASMGALQNRFASTASNLQSSSENLSAARSRIVDADFAQETATLSRTQILQQASTAMVAQANQSPQGVLALLR